MTAMPLHMASKFAFILKLSSLNWAKRFAISKKILARSLLNFYHIYMRHDRRFVLGFLYSGVKIKIKAGCLTVHITLEIAIYVPILSSLISIVHYIFPDVQNQIQNYLDNL